MHLRLRDRSVLLAGGGEVAARKWRLLDRAGANVRVVAPEVCAELAGAAKSGDLIWKNASVAKEDVVAELALVVAATDDDQQNSQVAQWARSRNIWVNVVDDPGNCTAITPAIVDRSPLLVSISSGGAAPVFVRRLRLRLEQELPPNLGKLLQWAAGWRGRVKAGIPTAMERLRFWEWVFDGPPASQVLAGKKEEADELLEQGLGSADAQSQGEVWLVGAGPGDPDLLTVRALRRMQQADVVLYDRLIGPQILDLVRRDADRIDVGKRRSNHTMPQEAINDLLVRLASEGKRVLRLKGGDPFVFGRGGEEISQLMDAGIPFEVIPGITAASGASSYAGIPLTHRDCAQSCIFVTGHPRQDGQLDLPWDTLSRSGQTVVIYMGLTLLPEICSRLIAAGAPASTPAALVENATREDQTTRTATLGTLAQCLEGEAIDGPALIIVGAVVALREKLAWRPEGLAAG